MMTMTNTKQRVATLVGAAALSIMMVLPAMAQTTSVTVTAGALSITKPLAADFATRSVTGVAQTTTAAQDAFSVSDLRGTGVGWRVTAQATQFSNGAIVLLGTPRSLPASSLKMSQPTVTSAAGTTSPAPTPATGPYTIDSGTAVTIASAAASTGMGNYDFSATTLTLSLPADVYADKYTSTVTISVISAP